MIASGTGGKILSPWALAAILCACLVAVYFLIPSDKSLLDKQIADGQLDRALATLRRIPERDKAANPDYYALTELLLLRKKLPANNEEQLNARFAAACASCESHGYKPAFVREVVILIPYFKKTEVAWKAMTSLLSKAPPTARNSLYEALTTQALRENAPSTAASVYDEFWRPGPRSEPETEKLVQLWRQASQPLKCLEVLDYYFAKQNNPPQGTLLKLERLQIDLLRETSQASRAFEAVKKLFARAPESLREDLFRLMATTALESNRLPELLPELVSRSQSHPSDLETLGWIGQAALSAQDQELALRTFRRLAELRPKEGSHFFHMAQLHEWRNQSPQAFDYYMQAFSLGESKAIPRLLALARGLYRDGELSEALTAKTDLVKRLGLEFEFARLQARAGHFNEAMKGYDEELRRHPPSVELLKEYGGFLANLYEYEKALDIYGRAERADPKDLSLRQAIAELKFRLGDYTGSFQDYEKLVQEDSSAETLDRFLVLADSLAKTDQLVAGLRKKLAGATNLTAQIYRQLAYHQNVLGLTGEAQKTIQLGLERFPLDKNLRLMAAHFYADRGDYSQAIRTLKTHEELKTNPQIALLYVNLLLLSQRHKEAEAFIKSGVSPELAANTGLLEPQAALYEASGRLKEAASVYAKLMALEPDNARYTVNCARMLANMGQSKKALAMIQPCLNEPSPEICQLLAQIYSALGDYKKAEAYQRLYIESRPSKSAVAWGYLGDILRAGNQKKQALQAYRIGMSTLLQEAKPEKNP